ncbi:hypothetical protein LCGC14_0968040 [marine sediment metagenome]|uniref:Uncharacterized protein n=1 Tax=marine sediment metagenome TaxID=412755 RepID=A0A0F9NYL3_9ZZZZ
MTRQLNIRLAENQVYDIGAGQSWPLGTRAYAPDGRVFRYAKNSAIALTIGKLVRRPEKTLGHQNLAVAAAAALDATSFTVTLTFASTTFDEYEGGLVYVNDVTGQGYLYGITGNSLTNQEGTLTVTINVPLKIALTTSSQISLIKNRYNGARVTETTPNERTLGSCVVAVPANNYFWAQVAGPAVILQDGEWDENKDLVPSTNLRGSAMAASAINQIAEARVGDASYADRLFQGNVIPSTAVTNTIGYALDPRADTEYGLVQLSLDV